MEPFDYESNHFLTLTNDRAVYEEVCSVVNHGAKWKRPIERIARGLTLQKHFRKLNLPWLDLEEYNRLREELVKHWWPCDVEAYWKEEPSALEKARIAVEQMCKPKDEVIKMANHDVKTKVFIGDREAADMTDEHIFEIIRKLEGDIESLGKIKASSTKLQAKRKSIEDNIADLVRYVDKRK